MTNRDKFIAESVIVSQCAYCVRAVSGGPTVVCPAFPGGVPEEILTNRFDHRSPHPDEATPSRFDPRPDVPIAILAALAKDLHPDAVTHRPDADDAG